MASAHASPPPPSAPGDADSTSRAIQPLAPSASPPPSPRRRGGGGGIVSAVSRWNPRATPRLTVSLAVYALGLLAAFAAPAPVTTTPEMRERYFAKMERADALDRAERESAEEALRDATRRLRRADRFMCAFSPSCRANRDRLRDARRIKLAEANRHRDAHAALVNDAKAELGLWSDLGVGEAKALFRRSYERGKLFATRSSYQDAFWLIVAGRSDDSMLELLLRWGLHVLSNFTVGMVGAVFHFAWALPGMIRTFAGSDGVMSGAAFFLVALIAGASTAASLLLLLFGTAGGVTYGVVKVAPVLARLEGGRGGRRARIRHERHPHWE